jgi:hypothetical protein
MKREKRKVNHESTKVPFDYAPFDLAQGLRQDRRRHERKHERRGVYLDTLALFRAFQFSCFRDWFLLWFLESLGR